MLTDWMKNILELREEAKTDPVTAELLKGIEGRLQPYLPPAELKGDALAIFLLDKVATMSDDEGREYIHELWKALELVGRDDEAGKAVTDYTYQLNRKIQCGMISDAEYARYTWTNRMGD